MSAAAVSAASAEEVARLAVAAGVVPAAAASRVVAACVAIEREFIERLVPTDGFVFQLAAAGDGSVNIMLAPPFEPDPVKLGMMLAAMPREVMRQFDEPAAYVTILI